MKELPSYIKLYTESYRDKTMMGTQHERDTELYAKLTCPVCGDVIRKGHTYQKNKLFSTPELMIPLLIQEAKMELTDHLNTHYIDDKWVIVAGNRKVYDLRYPQRPPALWRRIIWAITGKQRRNETWVI